MILLLGLDDLIGKGIHVRIACSDQCIQELGDHSTPTIPVSRNRCTNLDAGALLVAFLEGLEEFSDDPSAEAKGGRAEDVGDEVVRESYLLGRFYSPLSEEMQDTGLVELKGEDLPDRLAHVSADKAGHIRSIQEVHINKLQVVLTAGLDNVLLEGVPAKMNCLVGKQKALHGQVASLLGKLKDKRPASAIGQQIARMLAKIPQGIIISDLCSLKDGLVVHHLLQIIRLKGITKGLECCGILGPDGLDKVGGGSMGLGET